jgi:hypothetical protein
MIPQVVSFGVCRILSPNYGTYIWRWEVKLYEGCARTSDGVYTWRLAEVVQSGCGRKRRDAEALGRQAALKYAGSCGLEADFGVKLGVRVGLSPLEMLALTSQEAA